MTPRQRARAGKRRDILVPPLDRRDDGAIPHPDAMIGKGRSGDPDHGGPVFTRDRRAQRTGASLVLLRVIVPDPSHTHWLAVEERMREEAFDDAEVLLQDIATDINEWAGLVPAVAIRQGEIKDEVLAQIEEDSGVDVLVLAASPGPDGPGPLVTALAGKLSGSMRVPVTVVPGNLNDAQVDRLT